MMRILIADDHAVVRESLRRVLEREQGLTVVAEAETGEDVLTALAATPIDVVLLDVKMPGLGFLPLLERVAASHPRVRVLVLSAHSEEQYATRALKAGAAGYLTKDRSLDQLVEALRVVHAGQLYVSPSLGSRLAEYLRSPGSRPLHETLSDREFEVLKALAKGEAPKRIAAKLRLSPKTVSTYRARILEKLGVETNADLVRYVEGHGLGEAD